MPAHVCPWWGGYFIDNSLRRLLHNPEKIVGPYVQPDITIMDVGCGMGLFSIAMARMVGDKGNVIAVDLQQKMLDVLQGRAATTGVGGRIRTLRCEPDRLGGEGIDKWPHTYSTCELETGLAAAAYVGRMGGLVGGTARGGSLDRAAVHAGGGSWL